MGFFLRKAFRFGPLRLNLSKSGFGVSAGVTGARIGLTGDGRTYVHGGRGGLYYRKFFGSGGGRRTGAPETRPGGAVTIEVDTGATYGSPSLPDGEAPSGDEGDLPPLPDAASPLLFAAAALAAAIVLVFVGGFGFALGALAAAGGLFVASRRRAAQAEWIGQVRERFLDVLGAGDLSGADRERALREAITKAGAAGERSGEAERRALYAEAVRRLADDGRASADDRRLLEHIRRLFDLDPSAARRIGERELRRRYLEALADHELTHDEERFLHELERLLDVGNDVLANEREFAGRLRELREIRAGSLPEVEPGVKLRDGERCHFRDRGRILRRATLRRFQRDGIRYRERGFRVRHEGTLLVTSERILLVHRGTTSIRHEEILDLEVEPDRGLLTIVKDGRKTPVYLTTPDVLRAGVITATVAHL